MAVAIKLPDMGTNVEECKVHAWRVQVGEAVKRGDVLADIETDKAVAELESTAEGILLQHVVPAGVMAKTGDVLAYVGQAGESIPDSSAPIAAKSVPAMVVAPAGPVASDLSRARVSPMVKNLAAKMGVDLARVRGTGVGGFITREDVLNAKPSAPAPTAPAATGGISEQPTRGQAAVARAVTRSWKETPHLYISMAIDMSAAVKARGKKGDGRVRPSFDAFFLKALASAIGAFPIFAARWEGDRIVKNSGIHVALAVSAGDDLLLPVIRDVNSKTLESLQSDIAAVAASVRAGTLKPEQMTGGCMALSNLGMYPVETFEGIIFPGHSSILTVGAARDTPVVIEGRVEIRPIATASLAADHRLINGRIAAEFLTKVKQTLEASELG